MKRFVIPIISCFALGACNGDAASESKGETKALPAREVVAEALEKAAAPLVKSVKSEPTPELEPPPDLPVPADFEDEAETSITKSNYAKELGLLEKEIAADAPK